MKRAFLFVLSACLAAGVIVSAAGSALPRRGMPVPPVRVQGPPDQTTVEHV
jgi:hypothetical protein